jgi:hypothetical protein
VGLKENNGRLVHRKATQAATNLYFASVKKEASALELVVTANSCSPSMNSLTDFILLYAAKLKLWC